jgi:hypothetical protein
MLTQSKSIISNTQNNETNTMEDKPKRRWRKIRYNPHPKPIETVTAKETEPVKSDYQKFFDEAIKVKEK